MRILAGKRIPEYQNQPYRLAWAVLQNAADAQNALQLTFIHYHPSSVQFECEEHIRRWLFKTVYHRTRDLRRLWWQKNRCDLSAAR